MVGRDRAPVGGHTVDISGEQAENAALIASIAVRRGLPARATSIALATAYQESKIRNLESGHAGAIDQLVRLGAPRPEAHERPADWLARLRADNLLRPHRQSPLFTYCFELTRDARRTASCTAAWTCSRAFTVSIGCVKKRATRPARVRCV